MLCMWWMELGSYLHMQDLTVSVTQCSEIEKPAQQTQCLCVCVGMPFCSQRTIRLACTNPLLFCVAFWLAGRLVGEENKCLCDSQNTLSVVPDDHVQSHLPSLDLYCKPQRQCEIECDRCLIQSNISSHRTRMLVWV